MDSAAFTGVSLSCTGEMGKGARAFQISLNWAFSQRQGSGKRHSEPSKR
jgi:hypothetical protein